MSCCILMAMTMGGTLHRHCQPQWHMPLHISSTQMGNRFAAASSQGSVGMSFHLQQYRRVVG